MRFEVAAKRLEKNKLDDKNSNTNALTINEIMSDSQTASSIISNIKSNQTTKAKGASTRFSRGTFLNQIEQSHDTEKCRELVKKLYDVIET